MIRQLIKFHIPLVLALSLACAALGAPQQTYNCALGGLLAGTNLVLIVWTLQNIFQKKSVAFATTVIVFKYAALIGLFVLLYSFGWRLDFGFALGLSSLFPTLGYLAYQYTNKSGTDGSF